MSAGPRLLIAKDKASLLKAAEGVGVKPTHVKWGNYGYAGRYRGTFLAWGMSPSPLAYRAITAMLQIHLAKAPSKPNIFYLCYAGTHTSVLASGLHLGSIKLEEIHTRGASVILKIPHFDERTTSDIGIPLFLGWDVNGSGVYALGTGWLSYTLERSLCDVIQVACPKARACLCSVRGILDFQARAGGFLSRRLNLVRPGRHIVSDSLSKKANVLYRASRYCLDLSSKWKDNENHTKGEVIWIDGAKQGRIGVSG